MADNSELMTERAFPTLREANKSRQVEWDVGNQLTLAYRGNELAGEVGEACNVLKKLERERMGIAGSRDTIDHLAEELADVVICADLIAMQAGVDLDTAVETKFNATSEKIGLATRYRRTPSPDVAGLIKAANELIDAACAIHPTAPSSTSMDRLHKAVDRAARALSRLTSPDESVTCERCQGNGEIVIDWERYLHGPLDENGEDAVAECPDCNGTGRLTPPKQDDARDRNLRERDQFIVSKGLWQEFVEQIDHASDARDSTVGAEPVAYRWRPLGASHMDVWSCGTNPPRVSVNWETQPLVLAASLASARADGEWRPIETLQNTDELIIAYCPPDPEFPEGRMMIWRASMLFDQFARIAKGIKQPAHLSYPATHWRPLPQPPAAIRALINKDAGGPDAH